jgi:hypothetical protein
MAYTAVSDEDMIILPAAGGLQQRPLIAVLCNPAPVLSMQSSGWQEQAIAPTFVHR